MSKRTFIRRDLPRLFTLIVCVATQVVVARTAEPLSSDVTDEVGRRDAVARLLREPAGNRDVPEKTTPMDRPRPASFRPVLTARPGAMMADAQYVIITPFTLAESFQPLAQYKRSQGTSALVVAIEQIQALYADARDLPESIRQFLQDADRWWNTHFVLLGGDFERVPVRRVPNLTNLAFIGPEIATDLYYGALDGDWNADADDIIGELPIDGSPTDELDLEAELMVGRTPVRDAADVAVFISKTIQYQSTAGQAYHGRGLALAAENLAVGPGNYIVRAAEDIVSELVSGDIEPVPYVEQRYGVPSEWPGWEPMDQSTALARLGSGNFGWVLGLVPGDSSHLLVANVADLLGPVEFRSLSNAPNYFVMFTACQAADLDDDAALAILMRDPDGGCVAGVGHTTAAFLTPDKHMVGTTLKQALGAPDVTLGSAMNAGRDAWLQLNTTYFAKITALPWLLLGDPQLTLYSEQSVDRPAMASGAALFAGRPNPFNPSTEIRYRVPRTQSVEVSVFDVRGRKIAVLVEGEIEAGEHVARWDGKDASGRPVGSGVYFCRMQADDFRQTRKLVLVE
jgi:hypothetical protein